MQTRRRFLALATAAAGFLGAFPGRAGADIIHLKNGNQIQGTVLEKSQTHVVVRIPGGTLQIPLREVQSIQDEIRVDYLLAEAEKHLGRSDYEGALSYYQSAAGEDPGSERARAGLLRTREGWARQLMSVRRLREARSVYAALIQEIPDHAEAREGIAAIDRELAEAVAEEDRGARELDQGEIEQAHQRLAALNERFPDRRERIAPLLGRASVVLGHRRMAAGDLTEAEHFYLEALELQPDLLGFVSEPYVSIKIRQLRPLIEEGRFDELLPRAEEALAVVPASAALGYLRGITLENLGRWREAGEAYLRITGLERPGDLKGAMESLRRAVEAKVIGGPGGEPADPPGPSRDEVQPGGWNEIATEHFLVHHRNPHVGKEVAAVAEEVYRRLFEELGLQTHWYKPCDIYLYPGKEEFLGSTGAHHNWTGGAHRIVNRRGSLYEHRIESYQTHPRLSSTIIPHEVTHAMLAHRLRYPDHIPLWINEGFAIRTEPEFVHRHYRRLVSQARALNKLIKVSELIRIEEYPEQSRVELFYAQSYCLVDFLIEEEGLAAFLKFIEELSLSPESLGLLLRRHFKMAGPVALENRWRGSLAP